MILVYYFDDDDIYEYEVSYDEIDRFLRKTLSAKDYEAWLNEEDDHETEIYYDMLWEEFYDDAKEEYMREVAYTQDPLGMVGMSEKDFY